MNAGNQGELAFSMDGWFTFGAAFAWVELGESWIHIQAVVLRTNMSSMRLAIELLFMFSKTFQLNFSSF